MRVHIDLDPALVARVDRRAGARNRSRFVREAVEAALDEAERWDLLLGARGSIADSGHEWDLDPARWVGDQRHADRTRVG